MLQALPDAGHNPTGPLFRLQVICRPIQTETVNKGPIYSHFEEVEDSRDQICLTNDVCLLAKASSKRAAGDLFPFLPPLLSMNFAYKDADTRRDKELANRYTRCQRRVQFLFPPKCKNWNTKLWLSKGNMGEKKWRCGGGRTTKASICFLHSIVSLFATQTQMFQVTIKTY